MIKCQSCREKDVELLTRWERIRNWLFEHVNHTLFADDFDDLKSQKFTQGYSDGYTKGIESERKRIELEKLRYPDAPYKPSEDEVKKAINDLLSNVDLHKIVTYDKIKKLLYIGGEQANEQQLLNLRSEAEMILSTTLWTLIQETPKELAQRAMFVDGDNLESMKKGRSILYTLSTQKNIVDTFKNYSPK